MSYIEQTLMQGETVVYRTRRHKISCAGPAAFALLGISLGLFAAVHGRWLGGAGLAALALAASGPAWARYVSGEFGVTSRRVFMVMGWPGRKSLETVFNKVGVITVKQSVLGRLLDYGTVIVTGFGGAKEELHLIAAPLEFRRKIFEQIVSGKKA